ncbi:aminotransferase class V-fold PLP-dependent enzyme [Chelativorans sp. ZYF759]|uniref:cysteine desulfurase family protein n=1 Tax=Chelativorans sp. ZYF759 TaxID=2692213 RepID=UPI00145EDCFB|nr:cysteine desulfurase family protein [Chelativorans sp. ZYF759]NMG39950.1 aminotransferase class V-fold PLP-dependent enzyme [Chelativorans sp. ZYF759]
MSGRRVYLDHNATAPLVPAAREAMLAALETDANPSSVHAEGRRARALVEKARRSVAALCGARPDHVIFTSGATEAANMLLTPDWTMGRAPLRLSRLYVSASEHPCILAGGRFAPDRVTRIPVDAEGVIDLAALEVVLGRHDAAEGLPLVAVQAANNETGTLQPIAGIAAIVKAAGGILVCDAVQAAGRIPIDISVGYPDFLILSSHKMGGPKGAGAVVGMSDLAMPRALIAGGGQEKGHRGGTENVAAIAGFGAAAEAARMQLDGVARIAALRDRFEAAVLDIWPAATIYGRGAPRLANTSYFSVPGLKAETAQIAFDLEGVSLSAGSACSSGKVGESHVLQAMGHGGKGGAVRVSIGAGTGEEELLRFREALVAIASRQARDQHAA